MFCCLDIFRRLHSFQVDAWDSQPGAQTPQVPPCLAVSFSAPKAPENRRRGHREGHEQPVPPGGSRLPHHGCVCVCVFLFFCCFLFFSRRRGGSMRRWIQEAESATRETPPPNSLGRGGRTCALAKRFLQGSAWWERKHCQAMHHSSSSHGMKKARIFALYPQMLDSSQGANSVLLQRHFLWACASVGVE